MQETCSVEGCDRLRKSRGLCQTHYVRLWRSGSTGPAEIKLARATGTCSVEECGQPAKRKGFCPLHYKRWYRHGDPLGGYTKLGTADVGYIGAQHRVRAARGKATEYRCGFCGEPAQMWAYTGGDLVPADRRFDPKGRAYSGNPADYTALCRNCQAAEARASRLKGVGCKVQSCDRAHFGQGLCGMHYKRAWRAGLAPKVATKGSREIAYETAHGRVKTLRGSASSHPCNLCADPAREWAYLHVGDDPDRITDERGRIYSLNIDRYAPMCAPCHRGYDALPRR